MVRGRTAALGGSARGPDRFVVPESLAIDVGTGGLYIAAAAGFEFGNSYRVLAYGATGARRWVRSFDDPATADAVAVDPGDGTVSYVAG